MAKEKKPKDPDKPRKAKHYALLRRGEGPLDNAYRIVWEGLGPIKAEALLCKADDGEYLIVAIVAKPTVTTKAEPTRKVALNPVHMEEVVG